METQNLQDTPYLREEACSSDIVSMYPITKIVWQAKTPFADAVIADIPTLGRCLFLDHEIQSSSSDEDIYHECLVHPVMISAHSHERVLVIGGGEGATVREVLKWSDVKTVDWVDIDGEVVAACREYLQWGQNTAYTDSRVTYYAEDIRVFLAKDNDKPQYDVIIIDLPDPDPADNPLDAEVLMNRQFWCHIKARLASSGAWVSHTGPVRRSGLSGAMFLQRATVMADFCKEYHTEYHAMIPAFQDDWGYMMSCQPRWKAIEFPVRFLTLHAYRYIFQWPTARNSEVRER